MKKYLWALLCTVFIVTGCPQLPQTDPEDNEENTETPVDPENPDTPGNPDTPENPDTPQKPEGPTAELTPSAQKVKLQDVGKKIMDMCPAEDFNSLAKLMENFSKTYFTETYNWDELSTWFDNAVDTGFKSEEKHGKKGTYVTYEFLADLMVILSDHTGLLTLGENSAKVTEYNGTKAVFTLDGKNYEAVLTSKGKVTNAYFTWNYNSEYTDYGYYDYETDSWVSSEDLIYHENKETLNITVGFPEEIVMEITENGSPLATVNAKFSPKFTENGIKPTTDSFSTEFTVKFNGFEYTVNTLKFNGATGKAELGYSLKKDGTTIFSSKATADVKFDITTRTNKWESGEYKEEYTFTTVELISAGNVKAEVDILGEIQARGTCTDVMELIEAYDAFGNAAWGEYPDDNAAIRALNNVNAKFETGVYYDNGNNKQADIEFEYVHKKIQEEWDINGDGIINEMDFFEHRGAEAIIVFNDGSKYSIEDYFTEEAFSSIIEHAEAFAEAFADVFAYFFAEKEEIVPSPIY